MKPKFTDQLITGKGLPEVRTVEKLMQPANNVLTKATSLDLPSPTKVNITPLQHKQYSLDVDVRPKGHSECQSRIGGDIHPMKLADAHLSVKEPDSPSHSEVDRVKKSPGKGKESSHKIKKNKSPSTKKPKESQRKTSLSHQKSNVNSLDQMQIPRMKKWWLEGYMLARPHFITLSQ